MKRRELIRHLHDHGCVLIREGSDHSWWGNPDRNLRSAVPRHSEINKFLAKKSVVTWEFPKHESNRRRMSADESLHGRRPRHQSEPLRHEGEWEEVVKQSLATLSKSKHAIANLLNGETIGLQQSSHRG